MEITPTKSMPRKILELISANTSNPFEIFFANICVIVRIDATNITKISIENIPIDDEIMKNQNDNPAVTAKDLNRGDEGFILNWIDECH